uniref:Putative secreted protein n=1 Tax=Panstrongylus lignarius TaxID=156445 RepID=A0A224XWF7_9HEMI
MSSARRDGVSGQLLYFIPILLSISARAFLNGVGVFGVPNMLCLTFIGVRSLLGDTLLVPFCCTSDVFLSFFPDELVKLVLVSGRGVGVTSGPGDSERLLFTGVTIPLFGVEAKLTSNERFGLLRNCEGLKGSCLSGGDDFTGVCWANNKSLGFSSKPLSKAFSGVVIEEDSEFDLIFLFPFRKICGDSITDLSNPTSSGSIFRPPMCCIFCLYG